jgi:hypothetical protein
LKFPYVIRYNFAHQQKRKEKCVIELATERKTPRQIAKEVHISLKDIGKILRK